jgi:hypothetical protein
VGKEGGLMDAEEVLAYVYLKNAYFTIEDGKLYFEGAKSVLTPQLREAIAAHREELIRLVQALEENGQSLPDEIKIPASTPNTTEALERCINSQRDLLEWAKNYSLIGGL